MPRSRRRTPSTTATRTTCGQDCAAYSQSAAHQAFQRRRPAVCELWTSARPGLDRRWFAVARFAAATDCIRLIAAACGQVSIALPLYTSARLASSFYPPMICTVVASASMQPACRLWTSSKYAVRAVSRAIAATRPASIARSADDRRHCSIDSDRLAMRPVDKLESRSTHAAPRAISAVPSASTTVFSPCLLWIIRVVIASAPKPPRCGQASDCRLQGCGQVRGATHRATRAVSIAVTTDSDKCPLRLR